MRLMDADDFFKNYPELDIEPYKSAPTIEINTNDIEYKAYCKGLEDGKKIERPHGKWISKDKVDGHMFGYSCSNCRNPEWQITRFCPKCGAKMEAEK